VTPQELIAETFDGYFENFGITIDPTDIVIGRRAVIRYRGWYVTLRVIADDAGSPSLEFYATHRMTDDRHVRIWADGVLEELDAIWSMYGYDPKVPGAEEAARERYLAHNREVAERLRAAGLYPDGDINAYLRTGVESEDDDPAPP
jgi:hypothetical protein